MKQENSIKIQEPENKHIQKLRALWKEAFGDTDEFLNMFFNTGFDVSRSRYVLIEDEVAAALYWFDCELQKESDLKKQKIAYIYAVATAKAYRGQGLCHQLMEDTHKHLKEQGYDGVILVPGSKALFAFYEQMGYQTFGKIEEFSCEASAEAIDIKEIQNEEYSSLRRAFLPENGVVQEGANIDFLATYAKFYKGEEFLLAACEEGKRLRGVELLTKKSSVDLCLGKKDIAGRIVNTLGYEKGVFRTPSGAMLSGQDNCNENTPIEKDFAMFYALHEGVKMPEYFGLAFD